jgi:hypothetical protein
MERPTATERARDPCDLAQRTFAPGRQGARPRGRYPARRCPGCPRPLVLGRWSAPTTTARSSRAPTTRISRWLRVFVPAALRPHVVALYAFASARPTTFADEPQYDGHRSEALDAWQEELHRCFHGEPRHPVFVALHDTIAKRSLTLPPFEDLLWAFRADLEVTRYATFSSLRAYTARSAEPVGRLLLGLFGYHNPDFVRFADEDLQPRYPAYQLLAGRGRRRRPRPHLHSRRGFALFRR